jgi:uncharacterized protein YuzE
MTFEYDDDADVLYLTFEDFEGKESYVENETGDVLRLEPGSGKILGVTIPFFLRRSERGVIDIPEIGVVPFNTLARKLLDERKYGTKH